MFLPFGKFAHERRLVWRLRDRSLELSCLEALMEILTKHERREVLPWGHPLSLPPGARPDRLLDRQLPPVGKQWAAIKGVADQGIDPLGNEPVVFDGIR